MREGNRLEAKRAKGGLPHSLWETYSSFANTEGGLILLGVSEHEDHSLYITGVDDARNMAQDFWNMVHDPSKVSAVVLSDNDVVIRHTSQGDVISIDIPRAARDCIPVYVGQNPMTGSYRRNGDGDYLCDEDRSFCCSRSLCRWRGPCWCGVADNAEFGAWHWYDP